MYPPAGQVWCPGGQKWTGTFLSRVFLAKVHHPEPWKRGQTQSIVTTIQGKLIWNSQSSSVMTDLSSPLLLSSFLLSSSNIISYHRKTVCTHIPQAKGDSPTTSYTRFHQHISLVQGDHPSLHTYTLGHGHVPTRD